MTKIIIDFFKVKSVLFIRNMVEFFRIIGSYKTGSNRVKDRVLSKR